MTTAERRPGPGIAREVRAGMSEVGIMGRAALRPETASDPPPAEDPGREPARGGYGRRR